MTSDRERVLTIVTERGYEGVTVVELRELTGWHHGQASSALSGLHQAKKVYRLEEMRKHARVYVARGFVKGRPTQHYGRQPSKPADRERMYRAFEAGARAISPRLTDDAVRLMFEAWARLGYDTAPQAPSPEAVAVVVSLDSRRTQ